MKALYILVIALVGLTACQKEQSKVLTDLAIQDVYAELADIYNSPQIQENVLIPFLNTYYVDDGRYDVTVEAVTFPAPKVMQQDKKDVLEMAKMNVKTSTHNRMNIEYGEIQRDGMQATIAYTVSHEGISRTQTPSGKAFLTPFKAVSECNDTLEDRQGWIKIVHSDCHVKAEYGESALEEAEEQ